MLLPWVPRRRAFATLMAVVGVLAPSVVQSASASPTKPWEPPYGVVFTTPLGGEDYIDTLSRMVDHAPRGSVIRVADYWVDDDAITTALVDATRRGVSVRMVIPHNWSHTASAKRLVRELGTDTSRRSFIRVCRGSCLGSGGTQHVKAFSFSRLGSYTDVMVVRSGNLIENGASSQWNDSVFLRDADDLYDAWLTFFGRLVAGQPSADRLLAYRDDPGVASAAPAGSATFIAQSLGDDFALQRLDQVGCAAPRGYGQDGHTVIRVDMYSWYGDRGDAIAEKLAALAGQGCNVKAIVSDTDGEVIRILKRGGIAVRDAGWQWGLKPSTSGNGTLGVLPTEYDHDKQMTISGTYAGVPTKTVWTGSESWNPAGYTETDLDLQLTDVKRPGGGWFYDWYGHYYREFVRMWQGPATHRTGLRPIYRAGGVGPDWNGPTGPAGVRDFELYLDHFAR